MSPIEDKTETFGPNEPLSKFENKDDLSVLFSEGNSKELESTSFLKSDRYSDSQFVRNVEVRLNSSFGLFLSSRDAPVP